MPDKNLNKLKIAVYQTVESCPFIFRDLDQALKYSGSGSSVPAGYYKKVYECEKQCPRSTNSEILENLYAELNSDTRPGRESFRSMSVSDVISLEREGKPPKYFYCSMMGFRQAPFNPAKAIRFGQPGKGLDSGITVHKDETCCL